jgi:hypothetical protein
VIERCPPKAKVTNSTLVGRADQINDLCKIGLKRAKSRLTINSPTKIRYWRVIGGHSVIEWETNWLDGADSWRGFKPQVHYVALPTGDDACYVICDAPLEQFARVGSKIRPERGPLRKGVAEAVAGRRHADGQRLSRINGRSTRTRTLKTR